MSWTLLGGLLPSLIAISALLIFSLRSDTARLSLFSRLRSWSWKADLRGAAGTVIVAAAGFLLVAGIGAATYLGDPPEANGSAARSESDGETLAQLKNYTRSIGAAEPASKAAPGKPLPD